MIKHLPTPTSEVETLKRFRLALLTAVITLCWMTAWSQARLIKDINTQGDILTNEYSFLTNVNGTFYFLSGSELFKSNGTVGGTVVVKSFRSVSWMKAVGPVLYLSADDGTSGTELWKTDGTSGGTVLVKDIYPGEASGTPESLTESGGTLYFVANDGTGRELWKSNGTLSGTVLVKDIFPKKGSSNPTSLAAANGLVFFSANDGQHGYELWKSDGSQAGTVLVKDIKPGLRTSAAPQHVTAMNGAVYFSADDGVAGRELWRSDGTDAGTTMMRDIWPGGSQSHIENLTATSNKLFFTANDGVSGHELWKCDGTNAGTSLVKDMTPGKPGSHGENPFAFRMGNFTNVNNTLFYTAYQNNTYHIWKSDGTEAGTVPVTTAAGFGIGQPRCVFTQMNGNIYFFNEPDLEQAYDQIHLNRMDMNGGNIVRLKSFQMTDFYNPYYPDIVAVNNSLFLSAKDNAFGGFQLFKSDGTPDGTGPFIDTRDLNNSSNPTEFTSFKGKVFFYTRMEQDWYQQTPASGVWKTDGTEAGTENVFEQMVITDIEVAGDHIYAAAYDEWHTTFELWKTDGLNAEVVMTSNDLYGVNKLTNVLGNIYFYNWEGKLWKSDGTSAGTLMLRDFNNITDAAAVRDLFLFRVTTESEGEELWRSNGTMAGTYRYKSMRTSFARDSWRKPTATIRNVHYFVANDGVHGNELWATRGAMATTYMVRDFNTMDDNLFGSLEYDISSLGMLRDSLYVSAIDETGNWALYKSNGTGAGTVKIMNLNPVTQMISAGDKIYMTVQQGPNEFATDLWVTDGTAAGTRIVHVLNASGIGSHELVNGVLYFRLDWQPELWRSDGTECGTFPVHIGSASYPSSLALIGNNLYMSAGAPNARHEPHIYNILEAPDSPCAAEMAMAASSTEPEVLTSYPNPFINDFSLRINGGEQEVSEVSVFTAYGKPVTTFEAVPVNTDVQLGQSWPAGIYILKVNKAGKLSTHIVVKK